MAYKIYIIRNTVNTKVYIGQTKGELGLRLERHIKYAYKGYNLHISRAIRKYGANSFYIDLLLDNLTKEEANFYEKYYIKKFDSIENGYNMTEGGDGGNTYRVKTPQEMQLIKEKIGKSNMGGHNGNAHGIKILNVITKEEHRFGSNMDCIRFFQNQNIQIFERLPLERIRYAKQHNVQSVFNNYIFADIDDEFSNYSFYPMVGGAHPYKVTVLKTNEEYYAVSSNDAMNHFRISATQFFKELKDPQVYLIERI